jgi:hypothetical protein
VAQKVLDIRDSAGNQVVEAKYLVAFAHEPVTEM